VARDREQGRRGAPRRGDVHPANAGVLAAKDLFVNAAGLTGDPLPVE